MVPVADNSHDEWERQVLIRSVRQHLESLGRAGLDRIPAPMASAATGSSDLRRVRRLASSAPFSVPRENVAKRDEATRGQAEPRERPSAVVPSDSAGLTVAHSTPAPVELPVPSLAVLFGSAVFDQPPVPACDRPAMLARLAGEVAICRRCPHLADTRTQTVFGVGNFAPRLMFIGEAPGADEDRLGEPFVGKAGQLLTDMITKGMGLSRDQVYIANILKCRPPENRNPTIEESNNCFNYLEQQIAIIRPEFLCLLGRVAVAAILNTTQSMGKTRGKWHRYRGIPTLATYHPSYLLRTPSAKKDAWEDLQMLMKEMGLTRPASR
jgi:DNA polymerase